MVKNIIFDLADVVINCDNKRVIEYYAKNEGEKLYIQEEIFGCPEWKTLNKLDLGEITINETIEAINKRNQYKYEKLTKDFFKDWYKKYNINKEVVDIAKILKKDGYSLFVISNFINEPFEYFKNNEFFSLMTGVIISAHEHLMKPDEEIYKLLLNRYNLKADECIFIDDTKINYEKANKLGIKGRYVKKNDADDIIKMLLEFGVEVNIKDKVKEN